MYSYDFLLILAIILLFTKVFGLISEKVQMPQVVGALMAGIILGPAVMGIVEENEAIFYASEIGVILIMFLAGLETDLDEIKSTGVGSIFIALMGVLVPLVGGTALYIVFFGIDLSDKISVLKSIFLGVILTATSVSITVETLREMGKLKGKMGTTILGSAIIDDIIGIIILTIIISMVGNDVSIKSVIAKIIIYFVFIILVALVVGIFKKSLEEDYKKRRSSIYALVFCFVLSFVSEKFFGIANITGAYFAGVILCNFGVKHYISKRIEVASYLIFSPIFFTSIGLKISFKGINSFIIVFGISVLLVAIFTKVVGCFLGARFCKFRKREALAIAIGMVSRGEVALILAQKGLNFGILDEKLFSPIVIVVVITTLITPVLLKLVIVDKRRNY